MSLQVGPFLTLLFVGAIAGWLAAVAMKGRGLGLIGNIIIGVLGAFAGSYLLGLMGVTLGGGMMASVITAFIGSVVLLFLIGLIRRGK